MLTFGLRLDLLILDRHFCIMRTLFDISSRKCVAAPFAIPFVSSQAYAIAVLLIAVAGFPLLAVAEDSNAEQQAALEAILSTPSVPASQLPGSGNFYSAQRPDLPPMPANLYGLPAWDFGDGLFVLDDTDFDYGFSTHPVAAPSLLSGGSPLSSQPYTSNDLWVAINAVTNGSTGRTADLTIHTPAGDTNSSYDVFHASALASSTDWRFLMRCPTNIIAQTNIFARYLCEVQEYFGLVEATTTCDLMVTTNVTPQEMAELLVPPWVTITDASYTGAVVARGEFSNGNCAGFPVDTGVILSTGYITNAPGPNDDHGLSAVGDVGGDPDPELNLLVAGAHTTDDAAVLEFDAFSSNSCALKFKFVYASDEYPEFLGQNYNDPMAIFVSTNYVGGQWELGISNNVALIPGVPNVAVAVNTVNGGCVSTHFGGDYVSPTNALYYVDNHDVLYDSVPPYSAGEPAFGTQYDGMTVLLVAEVNIAANVTNHFKIAIADYIDEVVDSALFLEAWAPATCP